MMDTILLILSNTITSTISAITGVGGGMLLVTVLPFFLPAIAIIPIHGAAQLASNISRAAFSYKQIDWQVVRQFYLGALLGAVCFGFLVRLVNLDFIPLFIALYILLIQFIPSINHLLSKLQNFYAIGFIQTGVGLFVGATGSLHMLVLCQKYPTKQAVVIGGAMVSMVHILKMAVYVWIGFAFLDYLLIIILMSIGAVVGSWLGMHLRHYISDKYLKKVVFWLLAVIAIKIVLGYLM